MGSNKVRHVLTAALAAVSALLLAGCGLLGAATPSVEESIDTAQHSLSPQVSTPSILESGTLTVGIPSSLGAPYIVSSSETLEGMSVDIASLVADELGLKVKFVSVEDPESAIGKTCDVIMGVSDGEYDGVSCVGSYAESACAFFGEGDAQTLSVEQLAGRTVGVQSGSVSASTLASSNLSIIESDYANLDEAFEALENGSVDYVLGSAYPCAYLASQSDRLSLCGTLDTPSAIGIGVASTNQALQEKIEQALSAVQTEGTEAIVRARWVGGMDHLDASSQISGVTISTATTSQSTDGTATDSTYSSTSLESGAQDGSTAGANAVQMTSSSSSY